MQDETSETTLRPGALAKRVAPVVLGYLPVGFAFGVLAVQAGLSPLAAGAMSLFVYAGSAQLIAVGLVAAGAGPAIVIATTFVVNLRHLLMSAALAPYLGRWRRRLTALFCYELTDETFVLHSARFAEAGANTSEAFAINLTAHAIWVAGSLAGALAGTAVPDPEPIALDYALPAMFVALLASQMKSLAHVAAAFFAAGVSIALLRLGVAHWNVIAATVAAATLGSVIQPWTADRSS